jgi:hypothetical protein
MTGVSSPRSEEIPMTDAANRLIPEQGKFRRAFATVATWLQALDYTSFDYTLDRIERLEREVARLRDELRQSREPSPGDTNRVAPSA